MKDKEVDFLIASEEALISKSDKTNKELFENFKGAYRFASYLDNYCDETNWRLFIKNTTQEKFEELQNYYVKDWYCRPYSPSFKDTIGDITKIDYQNNKLKTIIKKLAYNDVIELIEYLEDSDTYKNYIKKLTE